MLSIQTFISPKNYNELIKAKTKEDFFSVIDSRVVQAGIDQVINSNHSDVYGAVIISYQDQMISTFEDWDDIDLIWQSLLSSMIDCIKSKNIGKHGASLNNMDWEMKYLREKSGNSILMTWHHGFDSQDWDKPKKSSVRLPLHLLLTTLITESTRYVVFRGDGSTEGIKGLIEELKSFDQ